mgnify:CR=1 FL=1
MLEEIKRYGPYRVADIQREVAPVTPYPRINPKQERQEGYQQQQPEGRPEEVPRARRRFTAMRELIEKLWAHAQISRVDFNTANQEMTDIGLAVAEEELLAQLLHLKIPLAGIEELIRQLRQQSTSPMLVSGRKLFSNSTLFPLFVENLTEYIMRFENLLVVMGRQKSAIFDEINNKGRFTIEHNRLRLNFTRVTTLPAAPGDTLNLTIGIQIGAVEIDENGRRAIFYQRADDSYALYSDKSISLSI